MPKTISKLYLAVTVLQAAQERIAWIFDHFEHIYVSVSAGKDSTALFWLVVLEAMKRGRKVFVFFLDQEAEYEETITLMRSMMAHPNVIPLWYQVPIYMTNATSYAKDQLYAWGEGEKWMREKEPNSIHAIEGEYPRRFYPFFEWFEKQQPDGSAFLVGLRAEESLNRFRAVVKNPSIPGIGWSSKTAKPNSHRLYPIYDWGMGDVWRLIFDLGVPYNRIYDLMYQRNNGFYNTMRVSNLCHEKSFKCLTALQELEPQTYERLIRRLPGTHLASIYAEDDIVFNARKRPAAFASWREYREHLLATIPTEKRERFAKRFAGQPDTPHYHRQQCRQLMTNDYENSLPPTKPKKDDWRQKWMQIL